MTWRHGNVGDLDCGLHRMHFANQLPLSRDNSWHCYKRMTATRSVFLDRSLLVLMFLCKMWCVWCVLGLCIELFQVSVKLLNVFFLSCRNGQRRCSAWRLTSWCRTCPERTVWKRRRSPTHTCKHVHRFTYGTAILQPQDKYEYPNIQRNNPNPCLHRCHIK